MDGFDHAQQEVTRRPFQNAERVPTGNDAAYTAEFYMGRIPNFDETDYKEVPHLRLSLVGDNNRVYDQPAVMVGNPARPSDLERFPREWARFEAGQDPAQAGTPLALWGKCEPGDVRRLEMQGLRTVEQLANLSDAQVAAVMGARPLRELARQHLAGSADLENERLRGDVEKLTGIMQGLLSILTPEQQAQLAANATAPVADETARGGRRQRAA
jgi:hypothetical protein